MSASVLNSPKAIEMSVEVVRAFVRLRGFLASYRQLAAKLEELEKKIASHDKNIVTLFDAVRSLMATPEKPKQRQDSLARCLPWRSPPRTGTLLAGVARIGGNQRAPSGACTCGPR
jgi:hypothetical protein